MISYQVQKGDTIAQVTRQLNTDWKTLRSSNPDAIGRSSRNGNWFLKEGATVSAEPTFQETLRLTAQQSKKIVPQQASAAPPQSIPSPVIFNTPAPSLAESDPNSIEYTIQPGDTLWNLAVRKYHVHVSDIMKDNGITDPKTLQVGQKITINLPKSTDDAPVVASWYGTDFHGKPMANGDIYDMHAATIAHKEIPLGTRVEIKNTETGQKVQATVTDRGPYVDGRDVDLSYGLAQKLSMVEQGVGSLVMRIL